MQSRVTTFVNSFLNIQVPNVQRIVLNELPARFNFLAHEAREHFFRFNRVCQIDAQELALGGIHRGFKQFLGL